MTTVCRNFSFTVAAACGDTVKVTLQTQESGGGVLPNNYSFDVGNTLAPVFAENFDGVAAPALPAGWSTSTVTGTANLWATSTSSPHTAPNKMFTGNPGTISENVLVSPTIAMPSGASKLTFRNFYNLESGFDGGILEIAVGAGSFQDILSASGTFVTGGYIGSISPGSGNPLSGMPAWTGNAGSFITTTINMPPFAASQNVKLRWRMGSDSSNSAPGWSIDSLALSPVQCGVPTVIVKRRGQITSN
jgi:hypothetical protein